MCRDISGYFRLSALRCCICAAAYSPGYELSGKPDLDSDFPNLGD